MTIQLREETVPRADLDAAVAAWTADGWEITGTSLVSDGYKVKLRRQQQPTPATQPLDSKTVLSFIVGLLLIAGVATACVAFVNYKPPAPQMVTVPDVVGFRGALAETTLEDIGLSATLSRCGLRDGVESGDEDQGVAWGQDPAAGAQVEKGSTVEVCVKRGM